MDSQVVAATAPLLLVNALFFAGMPLFALHVARRGMPADARLDGRRSPIGRFLPHYFIWLLRPLERQLIARRVAPDALTVLSIALAAAAAAAVIAGYFGLAGWLYVLTGVADICDGRVARATGRVSAAGALTDSVSDRLAEALIFSGLAWYYRDTWVLALALAALPISFLVSYVRARGEGLGVGGADIGAMQRPERIAALGTGLILAPLVDLLLPDAAHRWHWLTVVALGLVTLTSAATAVHRFVVAHRALVRLSPQPLASRRSAPVEDPAPLDDAPVAAHLAAGRDLGVHVS